MNVANEITSITVTGTANHSSATVAGNVTNKSLDVGNNDVSIVVTAEDGTTTKTYTVTVYRISNDATLKSLTVNQGTLSPAFSADVTEYGVHVLYGVESITVTGAANHNNATVTGNVTNKALATGDNVIAITVTAEDGTTTKTYTITVSRDDHVLGTEANLVNVTVNGDPVNISGKNIEYTADCDETSLELDLEASPYAGVTVNGASYSAGQQIDLTGDVTTVNIRVTAETGGAVNEYTLKVGTPIDDSRLYYRRWDDVLTVNRNPANNGGYNVSDVLWYRQDGTILGNAAYIPISGSAADYYADVKIDGAWHHACNTGTRSIERVVAWPNPVPRGESVKLRVPESFTGGTVRIYDMRGALVKSGLSIPTTVNSIDVSDLISGIYLLHVTSKDGNREVVKIVISD